MLSLDNQASSVNITVGIDVPVGLPSDWTKRKTKEHRESVSKAIKEDRKNTPPTPKPLYPNYYANPIISASTRISRERQMKKDKLGWVIGTVIIGIVVILSIVAIVLVARS